MFERKKRKREGKAERSNRNRNRLCVGIEVVELVKGMNDNRCEPIDCTCRLCCRALRKCPCVLLIPYLFAAPVNKNEMKREKKRIEKKLAQKRKEKRLGHVEFQRKMDAIRKDQEDRYLKRGKYSKGKKGQDDCDVVDFEEELDESITIAEDIFDRKIAEAKASGLDRIKRVDHGKRTRRRGKGKRKNLRVDTSEKHQSLRRPELSLSHRNLERIAHEFHSDKNTERIMKDKVKQLQKLKVKQRVQERRKKREEKKKAGAAAGDGDEKAPPQQEGSIGNDKELVATLQVTNEFHNNSQRRELELDLIKNKEKERTKRRIEERRLKLLQIETSKGAGKEPDLSPRSKRRLELI